VLSNFAFQLYAMTLEEINLKYSVEDLVSTSGDAELRLKLFAPILKDLYENKIIYYERFMCIAIIENLQITPEYFKATAIPYLKIERVHSRFPYYPSKPWTFGAAWTVTRLIKDHFAGYGSWSIWTEKEFVKTVEEKARKGEFESILDLTIYKEHS
jgi:hypothetical protein